MTKHHENTASNDGYYHRIITGKIYRGIKHRLLLLPYAVRYIALFFGGLGTLLLYANVPTVYAAGTTLFEAETPNSSVTFQRTSPNAYYLVVAYKPSSTQYVCSIDIGLAKTNSPTGTVYVELRLDSDMTVSSVPNDFLTASTLLATSDTLDVSTLTGSVVSHTFTFENCTYLLGSTTYGFTIIPTGIASATNIVNFGIETTNPYTTMLTLAAADTNGTPWTFFTAATNEPYIKVTGYDTLDLPLSSLPATSSLLSGLYSGLASQQRSCSDDAYASTTLDKFFCYTKQTAEVFVETLFIPNTSSTGVAVFKSGLERFTGVFPFNIFFRFSDVVKNVGDDYVETTNVLTITTPTPYISFTMSSTTLNNAIGSSTVSTIREYEENGIWLLTMLIILYFVFV